MDNFEPQEEPKPKYIGRRFLAGCIDYTIVYTIAFMLIFTVGTPDNEGVYHLEGSPSLIPILFWLFLLVCTETWFGATVGNSMVRLKPVTLSGYATNISFTQSLQRHLLDPIDMFFFGVVGILVIQSSDKNQRLGDIWAKTTVTKY
tara:strand:- start:101 stop:538 length:438 start_codon:yes stop_codon:yes gene_type:complete